MRFFGVDFTPPIGTPVSFIGDLRKCAETSGPSISADIDLVYVLSGRTTVLQNDADKLQREFDPEDDIERMREGIRIATMVSALRADKKQEALEPRDFTVPIFYNGRAIHNRDLITALAQGLLNYPKELFIIRDIEPENTIGQVQSFNRFISTDPNKYRNIAVVSSAYHLARVARTIGKDSPQSMDIEGNCLSISRLRIFLYGVHRDGGRLGMREDLQGECEQMQRYTSGDAPSIARLPSTNTFFTDIDFDINRSFSRALFWRCYRRVQGCNEAPELLDNDTETVALI